MIITNYKIYYYSLSYSIFQRVKQGIITSNFKLEKEYIIMHNENKRHEYSG